LRIVVASGKGGTGKTTIATNLALSLAEHQDVQLLDCDVEEPDAHLFLDVDLKEIGKVTISVPKVDKARCDFCGKCSEFCQYNAIAVLPNDVLLFSNLCHGCGGCALVCPRDAITEEGRVIGKIERGVADGIEFYHGVLNVGEPLAVPVVRAVKERADTSKTVVIDSPPGTSCPVVESMRDADFCLLVAEPTLFGLHDLKLAVQVARVLGVPFAVVINRDGVGDLGVETYCKEEGIPVAMRIPQDESIARLYSRGIPFAVEMVNYKDRFVELYRRIEEEVGG